MGGGFNLNSVAAITVCVYKVRRICLGIDFLFDHSVKMSLKGTGRNVEPRHKRVIDQKIMRPILLRTEFPGLRSNVNLIDIEQVVRIGRPKSCAVNVFQRGLARWQIHRSHPGARLRSEYAVPIHPSAQVHAELRVEVELGFPKQSRKDPVAIVVEEGWLV